MLKGIDNAISPELLKAIDEMGHGEEILLADANYPVNSMHVTVVRADGIGIPRLLKGILKLIPLDTFSEYNVVLMESDSDEPEIWKEYREILERSGESFKIKKVNRFDFYAMGAKTTVVVATGESALYANMILKKGVVRSKDERGD